MSLPPDVKKQYGVVMALGTKIGEKARDDAAVLDEVRKAGGRADFLALVRRHAEGRVPPALVESFDALVTENDWALWKSRLLVQAKMTRDGGKPTPGHEAGRGVGKP